MADNEKGGKAYIFYPGGFLYSGLESVINTTSPMDDIPGLIDFTLQSFTFKPFFQKQALANRGLAVAKLLEKNKKLRKGNILTPFVVRLLVASSHEVSSRSFP